MEQKVEMDRRKSRSKAMLPQLRCCQTEISCRTALRSF